MKISKYQELSKETATYPNVGSNLIYPVLGLCGESGEVAEKVKKLIRDKEGVIDEEFMKNMIKELGDVMWYISAICSELNISMSYVAAQNVKKLFSRKKRGVLNGSGDNR